MARALRGFALFIDKMNATLGRYLSGLVWAIAIVCAIVVVLRYVFLISFTWLQELYVWQPNYLHVYSDRLGGDFAIYPNERESFQKILDWTYAD